MKCPECGKEMTFMMYDKKREEYYWCCYDCNLDVFNDEKPPTKDERDAGRYLPYIYQLEEKLNELRKENTQLKENIVRRDSE